MSYHSCKYFRPPSRSSVSSSYSLTSRLIVPPVYLVFISGSVCSQLCLITRTVSSVLVTTILSWRPSHTDSLRLRGSGDPMVSLSERPRPHPRAAPSPNARCWLLSSASLFLSWLHPCLTQARILASGPGGLRLVDAGLDPAAVARCNLGLTLAPGPGVGREAPTLATIITIKEIVSFSDLDVVRKQKEARPGALRD